MVSVVCVVIVVRGGLRGFVPRSQHEGGAWWCRETNTNVFLKTNITSFGVSLMGFDFFCVCVLLWLVVLCVLGCVCVVFFF